jgi:hypothetical protein
MERFTSAQVYYQRKHPIDQEMSDGLEAVVAVCVAADYLTPGAVHDKVGNIGKGKYVTALGFARTKPCRASCEPRSQIPSSTEPEALKAAGKTYPHLRSARWQSDRREFGKRNICYDPQPVGLLKKVLDLVLLRSATVRAAQKMSS